MAKKTEEKEFFVNITATSVFERTVKVRAKDAKEAMDKAQPLWDKEAENGRFEMLDFERGHDWSAWPASEGIRKSAVSDQTTYTDYTGDEDEGKVKKIE